MAVSKAQQKATNKYNQKAYDRFYLRAKKGEKEKLEEIAKQENKSLNQFILDCITEHIENKK